MKTIKFHFYLLLIGAIPLLISCTVFEQTAINCPEFKSQKKEPAFEFKYIKQFPTRKKSSVWTIPEAAIKELQKVDEVQLVPVKRKDLEIDPFESSISTEFVDYSPKSYHSSTYTQEKPELDRSKIYINSIVIQDQQVVADSCDILVLITGDELKVKIASIGKDLVKYQVCDHNDSSFLYINKQEVYKIKHANGNEVIFNTDLNIKQRLSGRLGKIGLSFSILGLLLLVISTINLGFGYYTLLFLILTFTGLAFGLKALLNSKRNKSMGRYDVKNENKTIYILAIIIGSIPVLVILLLIIGSIWLFLTF